MCRKTTGANNDHFYTGTVLALGCCQSSWVLLWSTGATVISVWPRPDAMHHSASPAGRLHRVPVRPLCGILVQPSSFCKSSWLPYRSSRVVACVPTAAKKAWLQLLLPCGVCVAPARGSKDQSRGALRRGGKLKFFGGRRIRNTHV